MERFYFFFIASFLIYTNVNAQSIVENFDTYTLGNLNNQNPDVWGVWSGNVNGPESIGVSDAFASSGTQSGFIGAGPGPQDAVLRLGNISEIGTYLLSFNMYIPAGKTGYFNIQGQTTDTGGAGSGGDGVFNSSDLTFNNTVSENGRAGLGGGYGNIGDADPIFSWTYPEDAWFTVSILFVISDAANETRWTMAVDGNELPSRTFAEDEIIGGIDFFSIDANNEYYIDDILFAEVTSTSVSNPILENVKIYPNPVTDDLLTIEATEQITEITLYNLLGKQVLKSTPTANASTLDMSGLASGIYVVEMRIGDDTKTIKVMK